MIQLGKIFIFILLLSPIIGLAHFSRAEEQSHAQLLSDRLSSLMSKTLEEKIAHAEVKIPSLEQAIENSEIEKYEEVKSVRLMEDRPNGIAVFEVIGREDEKEVSQVLQTPYEAWVKVPVATHRIYPSTKLKNEDFRTQSINVASGTPREYRGIMISAEDRAASELDRMESKQTILEGQFVVSSALQRQPDIRKGETIKLELVSGELTLTTQAVLQESGSVGDRVRVLTLKTKKEIVGKIKDDHSVEVIL